MDIKNCKNRVMYIFSRKLGVSNAFFTRCGGVSEKYGLNLAFGRGDDRETVLENLRLAADAAGFCAENVVSCPQIHSSNIMTVKAEDAGLGCFRDAEPCDGYVTDVPGIVLGVKTADCVPILFSVKRQGKVVAVGAVHAGWRGTANRICENVVNALCELVSAEPSEIFAAIGPSAMKCCYEVGNDVLAAMRKAIGYGADGYFDFTESGRMFVDLKGINANILHSCGVPYENMDISELCTICETRYFYSHRRDGDNRGTHLNVVWME